jgi:AMP-polyphosphate phosphotransferase
MFESAELGHRTDPRIYAREVPKLREALLKAQAEIHERAAFPVIVLIGGVEAAGKGDALRTLYEWMDPRHLETHAFDAPGAFDYPTMWPFWQALPRAGTIGIFFRAWYREPLRARTLGGASRAEVGRRLDEIVRFERMLTDEGALVVKYWFHLSKKAQKKKLVTLAGGKATRWQVRSSDWRNHAQYDEIREASEEMLRHTSTLHAPWVVIEGADDRYRRLTMARVLYDAMRVRLKEPKRPVVTAPPVLEALDNDKLLRELVQDRPMDKNDYDRKLEARQAELAQKSRKLAKAKRSLVLVFEGSDAAGKGGAIRRVTYPLDARYYRVTSIAAPTEEERAHPYLWRFWRRVPRTGGVAIFDRSWYGRVLVERVEGFAAEPQWMRAYSEINDFEADLADAGAIIIKFWLQITKEEQLRRFKSRQGEGYKRFKLTSEDWRNRKKWGAYQGAACDMFDRTSTDEAPWVVVAANDKRAARVEVLDAIVKRLRKEI